MIRRLTLVSVLSATVMLPALSPAYANGVSVTLKPRGESAEAIRTGFAFYSLFRGFKNRAKTDQRGKRNGAAISQRGRGNSAYVFQRGRNNTGTIAQNGNSNLYGLFQFGRRNSKSVVQNGDGDVGITFQGNW